MTAANGAYSGTVITLNGWSISEVRITLNVTLFEELILYIRFVIIIMSLNIINIMIVVHWSYPLVYYHIFY